MNLFKAADYFEEDSTIYLSPLLSYQGENAPHMHEFLELVYIYNGSGTHSIDRQVFDVMAGDLLFINLGQTHAILSGTMQYINCLMKPEFIKETLVHPHDSAALFSLALFDEFDPAFDHTRCVFRFHGEDLSEVKALFRFMLRETSLRRDGYQLILSAYLRIIFSKMVRTMEDRKHSTASERLNLEILQYVNEHCFGKLSLAQLAEKYFYNPAYLSSKFKEVSGKSLSVYIREKRMDEAARLLSETELSVETVSQQVGYAEKGHFYTSFKQYSGLTPLQYRGRIRGET